MMSAAILYQAWVEVNRMAFAWGRQLGHTACQLATIEAMAPDQYPGLLKKYNRRMGTDGDDDHG